MEVSDEREAPERSRFPADRMALVRIIMGEQTVAGAVRIITEPQMPAGDVGEGLDVPLDAGQLQAAQEQLALRLGDFGLRPVAAVREVLSHGRHILQLVPVGPLHGLSKQAAIVGGPKILDDEDRRLVE